MHTASGRELTITVAYRLPLPAHDRALAQAEREGVRLSVVLRRATLRGLEAESVGPPDGQEVRHERA